MAALYKHKKYGYQVLYRIYLADGSAIKKHRYRPVHTDAKLLCAKAEYLECGSRRGNLTRQEIAAARRDGLINDTEAMQIFGGQPVAVYDLDLVIERYEASSAVANTPYGHTVNMRRARNLKKWLKKHPIPKLTDTDVKQYVLDRRKGNITHQIGASHHIRRGGVSAKTISNDMEVLRGLIDEAVKAGMVAKNVAREVNVPVKNKKVRRALSRAEVKRLMEAAEENRHLMHGLAFEMVMIALYAGLRRGELRSLKWDDVNLSERRLFVQAKEVEGEDDFTTKSGEAGSVGIPDRLYDILNNMKRPGPWVFGGKRPISLGQFTATFKKIVTRAGLDPSLSLHHARHTYGSVLLKKSGGDLRYVQERMRHLDIQTTKNYLHVIEDESAPEKDLDYV